VQIKRVVPKFVWRTGHPAGNPIDLGFTAARGKISKGDMLISGGNGFARPNQFPSMGTVIGKALQDFDGYEGVIEVAVGRL
jgi:hypothetical protein